MDSNEYLLNWAVELQSLAQAGLHYSKDPFDVERFQRIREISAEMIALKSGLPEATVRNLFCGDSGYQTPKLDVRCAVFREGRILLVRENEGRWTLPGGWMDVGLTVGENAAKEAREEAGVDVRPRRIIALQDWQRSNCTTPKAQSICKIFVQCDLLGGGFSPNIETTASGWFSQSELPDLIEEKSTPAQVDMCFRAVISPLWEPVFD